MSEQSLLGSRLTKTNYATSGVELLFLQNAMVQSGSGLISLEQDFPTFL